MPSHLLRYALFILIALPAVVRAQETAAPAGEAPRLALNAGHNALVWQVLFTPAGDRLISVSADKTVRFWDVVTGECTDTLRPPIGPGHAGKLYAAAISSDGQLLAVAGVGIDGKRHPIYLISVADRKMTGVLEGQSSPVQSLAFARGTHTLASGARDGQGKLWDADKGVLLHTLTGHTAAINGICFSPDGAQVATASSDKTARLWLAATGKLIAALEGHTREVRAIAWSPDGERLATGSADHSIRLWSAKGEAGKQASGLKNPITSLSFLPDSDALLFTRGGETEERTCSVVDFQAGRMLANFSQHNNAVLCGALSPDGKLAATAGGNNHEIYLWRTENGRLVHKLSGQGETPWSLAWSSDGKRLAWGTRYEPQSRNESGPLEYTFDLTELERGVARDRDSFTRAVVSTGGVELTEKGSHAIEVTRNGRPQSTLEVDAGRGRIWSYTLVGKSRAAIGTESALLLFDTATGKRLREFLGPTGAVLAVAGSPSGDFLAAASNDQVLRVYKLDSDSDAPVLSLFAPGDDWIAWIESGPYAASPGGERLMGWHLGRGNEALADFAPAARFRKSLYQPQAIRAILKPADAVVTTQPAPVVKPIVPTTLKSVAEVLPPLVAITSPAQAQVTVREPTLEIRALARSGSRDPLTSMWLMMDGRPYQGQQNKRDLVRRKTETAEVRESWTVELTPGVHRFAVRAETASSEGLSEEIRVEYAPEQVAKPALYVLAVGVSEYQNPDYTLKYCGADAREMAAAFEAQSKTIYREVKTQVVLDRNATRRGVIDGLNWLKRQMTQHDVGVFFFAGHGVRDDEGLFYLFPTDGDVESLDSTGVGEDHVKRLLQSVPGRLVLMLDACHTGAFAGDNRRSLGGRTDGLLRDLVNDDYGVVVMCSSTGKQLSAESPRWKHGAFTMAALDGLSGKADTNQDGVVYLNELDLFVSERVKELTGGNQTPVTARPATVRSFPLAKSR